MKRKYISLFIVLLLAASFTDLAMAQQERLYDRKIPANIWSRLIQSGHAIGSDKAPVNVVVFSDFQCPHCAAFDTVLNKYRKKHPDQLRVIIHNFPLPQHRWARKAAIYAIGVAKFGDYGKFVRLLYENQDKFSQQPWDSLAKLAGVTNMNALHGYIKKRSVTEEIQKDMGLGMMTGLRQTPTIIINRMFFSGEISYQTLTKAVNLALEVNHNH